MKEYLRQLTAQLDNDLARGCLVREYLGTRPCRRAAILGTGTRSRSAAGGTAIKDTG